MQLAIVNNYNRGTRCSYIVVSCPNIWKQKCVKVLKLNIFIVVAILFYSELLIIKNGKLYKIQISVKLFLKMDISLGKRNNKAYKQQLILMIVHDF